MGNPLFKALGESISGAGGNNPFRMIQEFIDFANNFKGDPKAEVQKLLQSGQMSQEQLNQLQGFAGQFQSLLGKFPQSK